MKAVTRILTAGVAVAAMVAAAPAAAQYYPPYGYGHGGNIVGQVLGGGVGVNSQVVVNQCASAVQARLAGGYGGYGYGAYASPYGANPGARVLGVSRVEPRPTGGLTVRGVANSGRYAASAYGSGAQPQVDLTWKCKADFRGFITDIDIDAAQPAYGYTSKPYSPYAVDYSQYGYRRY